MMCYRNRKMRERTESFPALSSFLSPASSFGPPLSPGFSLLLLLTRRLSRLRREEGLLPIIKLIDRVIWIIYHRTD
jgi:hypothetical protein